MSDPLTMWLPAVICCAVLVSACLAIARMARTVEQRLIDVDLSCLDSFVRAADGRTDRADPAITAVRRRATGDDHDQRVQRLRSIANHHRVADYLIIAALCIVAANALLFVAWVVPVVLALPLIVLLLILTPTAAWVIRRTPTYDAMAGLDSGSLR